MIKPMETGARITPIDEMERPVLNIIKNREQGEQHHNISYGKRLYRGEWPSRHNVILPLRLILGAQHDQYQLGSLRTRHPDRCNVMPAEMRSSIYLSFIRNYGGQQPVSVYMTKRKPPP
jgi:hypothetical protein